MGTGKILLCDLSVKGQFRAALWDSCAGLSTIEVINAETAEGFEHGVLNFLYEANSPFLDAVALAAPGWDCHGVQRMPNHGYDLDREWLRKVFNVQRVHLVNPTVARAIAIPWLTDEDFDIYNKGDDDAQNAKCVIGTGPGVGMTMLVQDALGGWAAHVGAGGHCDLAVTDDREYDVQRYLARKYGHVSSERAVSLSGLTDIREALAERYDENVEPARVEEILVMAANGETLAQEALGMCVAFLARMAGDVALMVGARGGIYLTGELMSLLDPHIDRDAFRRVYTEKGRLSSYLQSTSVYRMKAPDVEFKGLVTLFT